MFLHKNKETMKKNQGWNVLYIIGEDVTYFEFKTLYFKTSWKII